MKKHTAAFEVSCVAAALMVGMLVLMWAERPSAGCSLLPDAPRRLVLGRETDREHLARDLASVGRIARRYQASTRDDGQQQDRLVACEATLIQQIGVTHDLSPAQLPLNAQ